MDQNKFRTLLKYYLSCMDAEQATQLKLRQNQEYQTFIRPNQGMQEQLFIQGLPELQVALSNDRERKFILERSADGESLVDLHYGFPILKDEKDMISPLFYVEVAANFAGDQTLRLFPKVKNFSVNRAHFLGRYSPEEIEGIAENVSAVLFSNDGTLAKFDRMGIVAGYAVPGDTYLRIGMKLDSDPNASKGILFQDEVSRPGYEEFWTDEIQIFHNPNAKFPLPFESMIGATHHFLKDGKLRSFGPKGAILSSYSWIIRTKQESV